MPHVLFALLALLAPLAAQASRPFGELLPDRVCERVFVAERDQLQGVSVPVATYARRNECTLVAELFADAQLLARESFDAAELVDNAAIELPCAVQQTSRGRSYRVVLRSPDAQPGQAVTVWLDGEHLRMQPSYVGDTLSLGELTAGVRVVQTFTAPAAGLAEVSVLLTDYGRRNRGTLQLQLLDPLTGTQLAQNDLDVATVGNEDWRSLTFAPVADSAGRSFALVLQAPAGASGSPPGSAVTAYYDRGAQLAGELRFGGLPRLGRLRLELRHEAQGGRALWNTFLGGTGAATLLLLVLARHWRARPIARRTCRAFAIAIGSAPVLVLAYDRNLAWLFWLAASTFSLATIAAAVLALRRRRWLVQLALVPFLFVLLLALLQPFGGRSAAANGHGDPGDSPLDLRAAPWAFASAAGDPDQFRRWWQRLTGEWNAPDRGCALVQRPDPLGELPFVLQPGQTTRFFDSTIRVNNLGFRGADIARSKGDAFRIVCLGESTTMGQTLFTEDRPWPEVLQEQLNAPPRQRPIEVVNAGWASYDVRHSAIRLRRFVLDLQPDLVVLYHGYNGFWMLLPDVARASVASSRVPQRQERPSWLLAEAEYGLRLAAFRTQLTNAASSAATDLKDNACAAAYRDILGECAAHRIPVALCSFSMAVNSASPGEVIEFYRAGFLQVERQIAANELQTRLLQQLADNTPGATMIDTGRDLDGAFADAFVDLVHFTQAGRERLARNIAAGLRPLLPD